MMLYTPPVPLARHHVSADFECGDAALDQWIDRYAWQNSKKNMCRVHVSLQTGTDLIRGYYATSASQINPANVDPAFVRGLPRHPVPAILLARLAVHKDCQGQGLGEALIKDAFKRAMIAADHIGARVILVHALDAKAKSFYEQYGFTTLPEISGDGLTLYLNISTIAALVG